MMMKTNLKTVLYAVNIRGLEDERSYAAAYSLVSDERRAKTDRFKHYDDRCRCLLAELLMVYSQRAAGYTPPFDIQLGEYGKPYITNGAKFSISHSGEYVICAVSPFDVGCDIEQIDDVNLNIAKRFFTENECKTVNLIDENGQKKDIFYRFWTLKESFLKVTGYGMKLPLDSFEITLGEKIQIKQSVDEREYFFTEFDGFPGYKCSLCTAGEGDVALKILDIRDVLKMG